MDIIKMYLELTIPEGCINAYIFNSDCNALFDGLNNLYRKTACERHNTARVKKY